MWGKVRQNFHSEVKSPTPNPPPQPQTSITTQGCDGGGEGFSPAILTVGDEYHYYSEDVKFLKLYFIYKNKRPQKGPNLASSIDLSKFFYYM
jgi:hypothetical protein